MKLKNMTACRMSNGADVVDVAAAATLLVANGVVGLLVVAAVVLVAALAAERLPQVQPTINLAKPITHVRNSVLNQVPQDVTTAAAPASTRPVLSAFWINASANRPSNKYFVPRSAPLVSPLCFLKTMACSATFS
jgi:poly-beta-hydroxyalkanoate depolymerase